MGLVLGAEDLKPISWRVWAGQVEREGGGAGPFQGLEDRVGFVDIRVSHTAPTSAYTPFLGDWEFFLQVEVSLLHKVG